MSNFLWVLKRLFVVIFCDHDYYCINVSDEAIKETGNVVLECQKCGRIKVMKFEEWRE